MSKNKASDKKAKTIDVDLAVAMSQYSRNLAALRMYVDSVEPAIRRTSNKAVGDHIKLIECFTQALLILNSKGKPALDPEMERAHKLIDFEESEAGVKKVSINVPGPKFDHLFETQFVGHLGSTQGYDFLYHSNLISIASITESFFSSLLKTFIAHFPDSISSDTDAFSFGLPPQN